MGIDEQKLLNYFKTIYEILHLAGYYEGEKNVSIIQEGFKVAYNIIEKIKPN